jgi:hypothetical protein
MPVLSNPLGRKEQEANHYPGTTGHHTRLFIYILIAIYFRCISILEAHKASLHLKFMPMGRESVENVVPHAFICMIKPANAVFGW